MLAVVLQHPKGFMKVPRRANAVHGLSLAARANTKAKTDMTIYADLPPGLHDELIKESLKNQHIDNVRIGGRGIANATVAMVASIARRLCLCKTQTYAGAIAA